MLIYTFVHTYKSPYELCHRMPAPSYLYHAHVLGESGVDGGLPRGIELHGANELLLIDRNIVHTQRSVPLMGTKIDEKLTWLSQ